MPNLLDSATIEPPGNKHPPATLRNIFVGPDGLRSAWGILLFLVLLVGLRVLQFVTLTKRLPHGWMQSPIWFSLEESGRVAAVFAVTAVLALIERKRVTAYGLSPKRSVRLCASGALWGFITLSLLVAILKATGALTLSAPAIPASAALASALQWALAFFAVGLFEELSLRGYLQYKLARGIGFWWAALIWSAVFALMHLSNGGETVVGLIQAALIALFFCFSLWLTRSLWWAIGFHAAWDWAESFFYGAADSGLKISGHLFTAEPRGNPRLSGGTTGPEGSILALFVLAVPAIALWLMYRPRAPLVTTSSS